MLVKLQKTIHLLARYFIYGLAMQLVMLQSVIATGTNDKNNVIHTKTTSILDEDVIINGKVVDEEGNAIPGATILVKGTSTGTSTDIDGDFSLEAPEEAVIVVSFLGFATQKIEVGNQTDFEITLNEDIAQMDEVVVVGFGTQKKSHLTITGAIPARELVPQVPSAAVTGN